MTVNETEVLATLDAIEGDLDRWDQATFASPHGECGTTMCFAGWTLVRHGYGIGEYGQFFGPDGVKLVGNEVERRAADILGFDSHLINEVFYFFPEEEFEGCEDDEEQPKSVLFAVLKSHVLKATGVKEESKA